MPPWWCLASLGGTFPEIPKCSLAPKPMCSSSRSALEGSAGRLWPFAARPAPSCRPVLSPLQPMAPFNQRLRHIQCQLPSKWGVYPKLPGTLLSVLVCVPPAELNHSASHLPPSPVGPTCLAGPAHSDAISTFPFCSTCHLPHTRHTSALYEVLLMAGPAAEHVPGGGGLSASLLTCPQGRDRDANTWRTPQTLMGRVKAM